MKTLDLKSIKNKHDGQLGLLFGSGPTVSEFNYAEDVHGPIIKFGVNECIYLSYDMNYIVVGDHRGPRPQSCVKAINKAPEKIIRIVTGYKSELAVNSNSPLMAIDNALQHVVKERSAKLTQTDKYFNSPGHPVVKGPIANIHADDFNVIRYGSVGYDVLQLMVWMGFKTIVLIGYDTDYSKGTFKSNFSQPAKPIKLLDHWKGFHDYLAKFFPEVEVKVLRPVALTEKDYPLFETIDEDRLKFLIENS